MRNFFLIIAFISAMAFGSAGAQAALLYYGGDIDPGNPDADGIANGQNVANPDSQTYDNFTVTGGTWHVTNLFTNNLNNTNITGANWEIRSGVSAGNGGTLLFSGANIPATV